MPDPETTAMRHDGLSDLAAPRHDRVDDVRFLRAREKLAALADRLDDEQVLDLADSLHELLRQRRRLRARVTERLERKRAASGTLPT